MRMTDPAAATDPGQAFANTRIAARLRRYAELLDRQGEDGYRVRAYRAAADEIDALSEPLSDHLHRGGIEGLIRLRGIGRGIAAAIVEMLATGKWRQLERLEGDLTPERLFTTIPGVGPVLARRLADTLDADTLEHLEADLRLGDAEVPGIGPRRRAAILAALEQRLARLPRLRNRPQDATAEPPVSLLLDADAIYRRKAAAGELRLIAPRRFNPTGEAWLPILHARRGAWHLTVLFSNTARAHELGRTRDWVVIFFHRDDGPERQRTVVTETRGRLSGQRVIRGREEECLALIESPAVEPAT